MTKYHVIYSTIEKTIAIMQINEYKYEGWNTSYRLSNFKDRFILKCDLFNNFDKLYGDNYTIPDDKKSILTNSLSDAVKIIIKAIFKGTKVL